MISEGSLIFTIRTRHFKTFVEQCNELLNDGYYIKSCDAKTEWPYFWICNYTAVMVKSYVMDTETQEFAILPKDLI